MSLLRKQSRLSRPPYQVMNNERCSYQNQAIRVLQRDRTVLSLHETRSMCNSFVRSMAFLWVGGVSLWDCLAIDNFWDIAFIFHSSCMSVFSTNIRPYRFDNCSLLSVSNLNWTPQTMFRGQTVHLADMDWALYLVSSYPSSLPCNFFSATFVLKLAG